VLALCGGIAGLSFALEAVCVSHDRGASRFMFIEVACAAASNRPASVRLGHSLERLQLLLGLLAIDGHVATDAGPVTLDFAEHDAGEAPTCRSNSGTARTPRCTGGPRGGHGSAPIAVGALSARRCCSNSQPLQGRA